ncbi:DUF1493 family protein [Mucilaginibacter sp. 22184]|uniref:DUF1493 family protein n=1 Tax=Mucilaginibacter sp. 22184 TaxID=3453887 RepID=UPI003F837CB1
MDNILPELKAFIENYILEHKIKNVDLNDLNLNTSLDLDLNLFDVDIDLFITDFVKAFNIDYTKFHWKNYGYPDENFTISLIRSFLNYKSDWVKRFAHRVYKPRITVSALQQAIKTGVLT